MSRRIRRRMPPRGAGAARRRRTGRVRLSYPASPTARQPVHTVYGGAHLFADDTVARLQARGAARPWPPTRRTGPRSRARIGLASAERLPVAPGRARPARGADRRRPRGRAPGRAGRVPRAPDPRARRSRGSSASRSRTTAWTSRTATASAPTPRRTAHAVAAAEAMARAHAAGTLPPFVGIRVKPLTADVRAARGAHAGPLHRHAARAHRRHAARELRGHAAQGGARGRGRGARRRCSSGWSARTRLAPGALRCELMLETPQAILDARRPRAAARAGRGGGRPLPRRARGRLRLHGRARHRRGRPGPGRARPRCSRGRWRRWRSPAAA